MQLTTKIFLSFLIFFFTFAFKTVFPANIFAQSINWHTDYAYLEADSMTIKANGKNYVGASDVSVQSDPANYERTTLEAIWQEQGVEMRLFIYFNRYNGVWSVSEMRTYDGNTPGDWIYYNGFSGGNADQPLTGNFTFNSKDNQNNQVVFTNLKLLALPSATENYHLEMTHNSIVMTNKPGTGFGLNALLKDSSGNMVTNQSSYTYLWFPENTNIVKINTNTLCIFGISEPCPLIHADLTGVNPGTSKIWVKVLKDNNRKVVAEAEVNVTVNLPGQITPTPITPTATPTQGPINEPTPTSQLLPTATSTPKPSPTRIEIKDDSKDSEENVQIDQIEEVNELKKEIKEHKSLIQKLQHSIEELKSLLKRIFRLS